MEIKRIAIDLDGVVFDSIRCICELYNEDFQYYNNFVPVTPDQIKTWKFNELACASEEAINNYFCQPRFFDNVKLMSCAKWIIDKLSDDFEINFVTSGRMPNLRLKQEWKDKNFPYARLIGVNLEQHETKGHLDLRDCIFVEDAIWNLESSNAPIKICYGKPYPWNMYWQGVRCETWSEVYGYIRKAVIPDADQI